MMLPFANVTAERPSKSFHHGGVELGLYRLWESLLARADISLTDNFFEMGGTAPLAKELCRQIRQTFGCEISMQELCEAPSIGALSLVIRTNGSGQRDNSLVQLQMGTPSHPCPIYCFHPISGSTGRYTILIDVFDRDQPIYGLQAVGLAGRDRPDCRVDVMADRYSRAIKEHGARGAVFLGYSFGGLLAVETARRLSGTIAGPAIGVIDCSPLEKAPVDNTLGYRSLVQNVLQLDADINSLMPMEKSERLAEIRAIATRQGRLPMNFSLERLERMVDVCHANQEAADAYELRPGGGSLTVFESDEGAALRCGKQWEDVVAKVTTHALPGDHDSIMEGDSLAAIALWVKRQVKSLSSEADLEF
jgi:thioesterase domain-containing protein